MHTLQPRSGATSTLAPSTFETTSPTSAFELAVPNGHQAGSNREESFSNLSPIASDPASPWAWPDLTGDQSVTGLLDVYHRLIYPM